MYSFAFPDMLGSATSNIIKDKAAIISNLQLLFSSEKRSFFGDPEFGASLVKYIYEQSHSIVVDLLIDELYTTIAVFMPQIRVDRKDIKISTDGTNLFASLRVTYLVDNTSDLYTINLTNTESF